MSAYSSWVSPYTVVGANEWTILSSTPYRVTGLASSRRIQKGRSPVRKTPVSPRRPVNGSSDQGMDGVGSSGSSAGRMAREIVLTKRTAKEERDDEEEVGGGLKMVEAS